MPEAAAAEKTLLGHLDDLRRSLFYSSLIVALCLGVTLFFCKEIYTFLALPLKSVLPENSYFIATQPFEAWVTYFKTALFAALFVSSPLVFWQIWRFVAPGLFKKEKTHTLTFVLMISLFFVGGGVFGYYVVFPQAFVYFTAVLEGTGIVFLPKMDDYLGFACRMLITFGVIFEMPVIVILLTKTGLVKLAQLKAFRKYMIIISFIIAAILTPPDVVSQMIMGLPMVLLYEVGLVLAWILGEKKQTQS